MTLNGRTAFYYTNNVHFEVYHGDLKEDKTTLLAAKCSPGTPLSGGITFVRIFMGITWRKGLKQQSGGQNRQFLTHYSYNVGVLGMVVDCRRLSVTNVLWLNGARY